MSRLTIPSTVDRAPVASHSMLEAVKKKLGEAPNMYRLIAVSPAALEGFLALSSALEKGTVQAATRERIALAVAEINDSKYCLSVHSALARAYPKFDDAEIAANRNGHSNDPRADAAVMFAAKVAREHGHITGAELQAFKAAGYDDAQVIEIVQLVALNVFANYLNLIAATEIDFPLATQRKVA